MKYKLLNLTIIVIFLIGCQPTKNESIEMEINDPHSYAEPNVSRVKHMDWQAKVDFDNKIIKAKASLFLENASDARYLKLDSKGLKIEKVTRDEEEIETGFELGSQDEILGEELKIEITAETKVVHIYYVTSPGAEALQWLSPIQTAGKSDPFLFTQSQAILARSWVPIQDSPGLRFTYNAQVEVPRELLALMSAENPQEKNETGIYNFTMAQPIPAYLLALAVGNLEFESLGERSGVYAEASVLDKAVYEFADLENMITAAEDLYGPYQWDRYDLLVLPPSFPFGGMENPRLTFATPTILAGDRSLTSLVAHELAHSWSGNLVTNATWNDFWINEGFTVYFEQRIMEKLYGREYSEMLASLSSQDLREEIRNMMNEGNEADTRLKLELEGRNPDDGVTTIAYDKGYLFLRYLEELVGREKFDEFLKNYFERNAFEVMTTEEFIEQLNEHLLDKERINLGTVKIHEWIYNPGLPDDAPRPTSDKFEKVTEEVKRFANGTPATELDTTEWTSHEWLHFVRSIPDSLPVSELAELDKTFGFTQTGNSEVITVWLVQSIKHNYKEANNRLKDFLIHTGRRKFLSPIYKELMKSEEGKVLAKEIYTEARPNYHFVATNTIDEMLNIKN